MNNLQHQQQQRQPGPHHHLEDEEDDVVSVGGGGGGGGEESTDNPHPHSHSHSQIQYDPHALHNGGGGVVAVAGAASMESAAMNGVDGVGPHGLYVSSSEIPHAPTGGGGGTDQLTLSFQGEVYVFDSVSPEKVPFFNLFFLITNLVLVDKFFYTIQENWFIFPQLCNITIKIILIWQKEKRLSLFHLLFFFWERNENLLV